MRDLTELSKVKCKQKIWFIRENTKSQDPFRIKPSVKVYVTRKWQAANHKSTPPSHLATENVDAKHPQLH